MRAMTGWITVLAAALLLASASVSSEPVGDSLYQLDIELTDQAAQERRLDLYRGRVTLLTLFYGGCPMTCPLLIDTVRAVESALTADERKDVRVLLVSIDPERDTPAALAALAHRRRIDASRWTLARASTEDVRMLAATLNIQYRRLPNGEFNHTSVISVLGRDGELLAQSAVLGRADATLVQAVRTAR